MFLYDENNQVTSDITPVNVDTLALVNAIEDLRSTKKALEKEEANIPVYTGQYDSLDYIANEQNDYNIAVNAFGEALRDFIWKTSPKGR